MSIPSEIVRHSLQLQKAEVRLFPLADVIRWSRFVEGLQNQDEFLEPFDPVRKLAYFYLGPGSHVLDIGCETGKNALCLIEAGHQVTILDIAPRAVQYTVENLRKKGMNNGIVSTIIGKIEKLDPGFGPFEAVVGTYTFSFIPPEVFEEVMEENVFNGIASGGYFAGGFFGPEHAWANNPELSILTAEKLMRLFSSKGFIIYEMTEKKRQANTLNGKNFFHTINVIAQKIL